MKKIFYAVCLILLVSSATTAQQETEFPRVEIFGGYSHLIGNQQGFNVSATGNINKWFGVVADFSRLSSKITEQNITEKITGNIYLFGPQFSYRGNKRVTPFARVLLGAATASSKVSLGSQSLELVGGGLDIRVSKNVAIRAVQADYIHTSAFGEGQHNGRLSFGVVFRFGNR
jgi:hypothetical protein